jgi:SAM-dependent methyltransferase
MEKRENYTKVNSEAWDRWAEDGNDWSIPISHEGFLRAKQGEWDVLLTPMKPVPKEWFPPFPGLKILGLASGGGQQMPVFTALGAECTIFDNSARQLNSERMVAERENYRIDIVRGDMTRPLPFRDESFDLIFHPVSNCFIEEVQPVWNECFRVLKHGGVLLAGMDNGLNFLFNDYDRLVVENPLPFNPLKNPALYEEMMKNDDGLQFSHTMEEQVGGQLKAGFRLTDLYEDRDRPGNGRLQDFAPTYLLTRAVKP